MSLLLGNFHGNFQSMQQSYMVGIIFELRKLMLIEFQFLPIMIKQRRVRCRIWSKVSSAPMPVHVEPQITFINIFISKLLFNIYFLY